MGYTYRLSKETGEQTEDRAAYRLDSLNGMTTYQLREICRNERLVVPMGSRMEREELIRFIMRYRGIREYRHITDYAEGGMERLQAFVDKVELREDQSAALTLPAHLVIYEDEGIALTDHYEVSGNFSVYEGNLLLVDEKYQVYTCLYLKQGEGQNFYLLKGKSVPVLKTGSHKFFLLYFQREELSELIYEIYHGRQTSIPKQAVCIRTPLLAVDIRQPEKTALPLIIDFGSSNTTMGKYDDDGSVRTVRVADTEGEQYRESELIPSVIGVAGIEDGKPVYRFGFEARRLEVMAYHDEDCPVFYDIKRWVSAPEREQEVITTEGIKIRICRREMLTAFVTYLIDTAQQQFKCKFEQIQLLAPVRQKERFEELFRELLPDYRVECALDEGMAVLFHSINELIQSGRYADGMWYQALIMDCGGGTTDLTAGRFCIHNNRISYEVDLETGYENGNTNFGGNNLTFRIMQLLKLKILEVLGDTGFRFEPELSVGDVNPGVQLDRMYEEAEKRLPTRFAEYELKGREEYFRVKNNYYYLFGIAETIKERFFGKKLRYELRAGCNEEVPIDKWRISLRENGRLVSCRKDFSTLFYLYEIENLLRVDIYELMTRFLEKPFINGELAEYGMLKLTGQSCKSRLFTEALKEFVPGRLIRNERDSEHESELKMCCLEGAISYFKNLKLGYMKINQKYRVNALPYEVTAYTHENRDKILIHSLRKEQDIGYISRFKIGEQLDLYLRDETGQKLKVYHFNYDVASFIHVTQENFNEQYTGTVIQEQTDIIVEGEIKFFVWPARDRWGFMVLPVLRENELLKRGEETFFAFEDDTWEENFFDGRK
ncbi:MAG: hypothetical protein K2J99_17055 [Lachnospiraceae bacterium]|nr:hypothetical protein [Lachnospiraceae bacterium]